MAKEPPSPSASSTLLPFLGHPGRRGSLSSVTSRKELDKDTLAHTLDSIHTLASKTETFISFHDFDGGVKPGKGGPKEAVSSGVAGLYNRFKRSVGGPSSKESKERPQSSASRESVVGASPPPSSPSSSNHVKSATFTRSADAASISVASPAPSPVAASTSSTAEPASLQLSESRSESREDVSVLSRQSSHRLAKKDYAELDSQASEQGDSQRYEERPTREDMEMARSALVDNNRSESATAALARVLSNDKALINEQPRQARNLRLTDDSDDDTARSPSLLRSHTNTPQPLKEESLRNSQLQSPAQTESRTPLEPKRPPLTRPGASHLPGFEPSRASSTTDGGDLHSTSSHPSARNLTGLEASPNINGALQRMRDPRTMSYKPIPGHVQQHTHIPTHLKRRVISKEFWMKDENAKDCFYCGQAFSTFRRKHHCRTCGQIFDARCTSLVTGRPFGQPGTIRLCKPCEAMIYGSDDDDSTVFSDDGDEFGRSPATQRPSFGSNEMPSSFDEFRRPKPSSGDVMTPSIGIPASRRNREAKRRSAVIEFDAQPTLARPSSSRSLISLSGRPRSSSHRRHQARHPHPRNFRISVDERGPFYQETQGDPQKNAQLPAFHNDNIIDPDLAPFLSDEGSDEDDQPNIMSAFSPDNTHASPGERERLGIGGFLASAMKKGRSKLGDRASVKGFKDDDALSINTRHLPKLSRKRNSSMGSLTPGRPSPRRSRSNMLLKTIESGNFEHRPSSPLIAPITQAGTKMICSSAMHGMNAPPVELNSASLEHVRKLLAQMLHDFQIDSLPAWEKALLPMLLRCADDVDPDVQRDDDMDIRHYIKLKKVPGGKPGDTSYVSGVVFSKNIALKSMSRHIRQPRIAIVTFAIEYARHHAHFMSLDPILAQEKEYLENLVARITALGPQLLLVQRNVSGYALQLLEQAGITVAYNIKDSVLAAVARVTQSHKITSVDKLQMDPSRLGSCGSFDVKAYMHQGVRKSYIYLSGCQPDLGCTIVLRGADTKCLRKIKRVTEFMCYVVYNLRLETCLMRDEFVAIPSHRHDQLEAHDAPKKHRSEPEQIVPKDADIIMDKRNRNGRPHVLNGFDRPPIMTTTNGIVGVDVEDPELEETPSKYAEMEERCRSRILSASPFVVFMQPYLLTALREQEMKLAAYRKLRDQYAAADEEGGNDAAGEKDRFSLVKPEMVGVQASKDQPKSVREYLHAVYEAQHERVMHSYENSRRLWESFIAGNSDPFDPYSHQTIVVLYSMVSSITSAPCDGPQLLGIGFYAGYNRVETSFEEDCTLGQFIENVCLTSYDSCRECNRKLHDHSRQYVHGYGQLSISVSRQPPRIRGLSNTILMWSSCRICNSETTIMPMSDNTWKYSFAKYLELSFWSSPLHPRAGVCQHDIHKDFLRCFGFQDLVVTVQYDPVDIYDIVVPRPTVTWKVESDLTVKNEQYTRFETRLNTFITSVKKRLDSIHIDALEEKLALEAQEKRAELRQCAEDDRIELLEKLQSKYSTSRYYELIPLNRALRMMDEKAIAWDEAFSNFERDYFPSETDIRKLATLQLKKLFLDAHPSADGLGSDTSDTEDGPDMPLVHRPQPHKIRSENFDFEKAHDVMSSVVEEHKKSLDESISPEKIAESMQQSELDNNLTRRKSPQEEHAEAVERDEVRHLDLAVARSAEDGTTEDQVPVPEPREQTSRPVTRDGTSPPEPFAVPPKPLGPGLLERIEQIRNDRAAAGLETPPVESKIPRLADLKKRDVSPNPPRPSLGDRTKSSPSHVARRSTDMAIDQPSIDSVANIDGNLLDKRLGDRLNGVLIPARSGRMTPSLIPRSIPINNTSVSALAKHFEQMSREFEKERLRERRQRAAKSRQSRANPLASSRPVVEVYRDAREAVGERSFETFVGENTSDEAAESSIVRSPPLRPRADTEPAVMTLSSTAENVEAIDQATSTKDAEAAMNSDLEGEMSDVDTSATLPGHSRDVSDPTSGVSSSSLLSPTLIPDFEQLQPELGISDQKKSVWFKYLSEFWSKRSASGWANLEYPLHATEHVFEDSDIIVREDEPSSAIALSLACGDYVNKVKQFRSHPNRHTRRYNHGHKNSQNSNTYVAEDEQQKAIEASLLSDTGTHMKYSFSHGQARVQCKIFYAESFDALRRRCGVADRFVESLSRCFKYDSKGGKTKSLFLKTLDNRFIVKSLQEVELKAFTKFAPDYFAFMGHTLFHGVPSVIAKMFGLYQVVIRNPATGMDFSYYLLVMENLFYERNPNRRFDLKGSMRNRKIESTGQPDEVLLDENLVETIFEKPLFVREHARKLLQASVWNDTLWLCKQNVMDYSLMAGFDDECKELIVGIIDCIRTYTWDKKLESWIKDRGKNKPTITSPKDYRNRFRVSMMQYVLQAPNCWHQFQAQMAPPRTLRDKDEADETATGTDGER